MMSTFKPTLMLLQAHGLIANVHVDALFVSNNSNQVLKRRLSYGMR